MAVFDNYISPVVSGTNSADVIANHVNAFIHGYDGNDQIDTASQLALVKGDGHNDVIANHMFNSAVYLDGGPGHDYVANLGSGFATIYGGHYTEHPDRDYDILVGSPYAVDYFVVGEYCGGDVIMNSDSSDVIYFAIPSGYPATSYVSGADLVITHYSSTVVVKNWTYSPAAVVYTPYYQMNTAFDTATDEAGAELWGGANVFTGTAEADNIFISKNDGNDLVFDAAQDDTIHFYDATLSDIVGTAVSDNAVAIAFNTGETAVVATSENVSPKFKLASGESYVYNREAGAWQEA